jgi:subfamily B ATP-binding cassette protein MsbA
MTDKPAIRLLFDEATTVLDSVLERHVQVALEAQMQNHTTLVISHCLSTNENTDRIDVLQKGETVEIGTPQELLNIDGVYARLHRIQLDSSLVIADEMINGA